MQKSSKDLPKENLILFDYLTFTIKEDWTPNQVIQFLGLEDVAWDQMEKGLRGYRRRMHSGNISILYDGADNMGICVDMSGSGCRYFETYSTRSWDDLFADLLWYQSQDLANISRLDAAFDDHTGILDIDVLRDDTDDHLYVSRSRTWKVEYGSAGTTIYHGSPKSNMYIRIYDKAAEQGIEDAHWIRVEMQMRDEIALGYMKGLHVGDGVQFRGVLHNYLRYVVDPGDDSNMSRWPLADYWEELLEAVQRIRCWSAPGVNYTVFHLQNLIINQMGNALDCYLTIFGTEDLIEQLGKRAIRQSPKYEKLKQQHQRLLDRMLE